MKSFIFALIILLSSALFVTINSAQTVKKIDKMLAITDALPKTEDEFLIANGAKDQVEALIALWDVEFPSIVCTLLIT